MANASFTYTAVKCGSLSRIEGLGHRVPEASSVPTLEGLSAAFGTTIKAAGKYGGSSILSNTGSVVKSCAKFYKCCKTWQSPDELRKITKTKILLNMFSECADIAKVATKILCKTPVVFSYLSSAVDALNLLVVVAKAIECCTDCQSHLLEDMRRYGIARSLMAFAMVFAQFAVPLAVPFYGAPQITVLLLSALIRMLRLTCFSGEGKTKTAAEIMEDVTLSAIDFRLHEYVVNRLGVELQRVVENVFAAACTNAALSLVYTLLTMVPVDSINAAFRRFFTPCTPEKQSTGIEVRKSQPRPSGPKRTRPHRRRPLRASPSHRRCRKHGPHHHHRPRAIPPGAFPGSERTVFGKESEEVF
jgi:hypothetical protein